MARISVHQAEVRRSGVALIIVIAMLALFAMVGLSFAFYAEYESDSSRFLRMAQSPDAYDLEPEKLFSYAMGQLICGVDPTKAPKSKMYRLSLADSIYGIPGGTIPFNGLGHPNADTKKHSELTWNDNIGINVPYTYPDINNLFLARVGADGKITHRSFYRNGEAVRPTTLTPIGANKEGDVRNMNSASGDFVNDSFWMDLDFPVHIAKDGTRYKPLFAFFVIDLDGRVNLAVAGNHNVDYADTKVATSRCGLGAWEINPAKVLTSTTEIKDLFKSGPTSRHGSDSNPDFSVNVTFPTTSAYGRIDYKGTSAAGPSIFAQNSQFLKYPLDWTDAPGPGHAAGYDYFEAQRATGTDRALSAYNVEPLVRWRDRGSAALTSDLVRLLKTNLTPANSWTNKQELSWVTPFSMSLDTAHLAPFLDGTLQNGVLAAKYELNPGDAYPKLVTPNKAPLPMQIPPAVPQGDFSATGVSHITAEMRRINLNRTLNTDVEKLQLVQEIFDRLLRVTGATPPTANAPFLNPDRTSPKYRATRWLAQYAVNIVDSIDADNAITKFKWNPHANDKADYVFGVEHNRLVINEVFVTVDNDKNDKGIQDADVTKREGTEYRINAWAELFNPMINSASNGGNTSLFAGNNQPIYRLLMAESPDGISDSPTGLPSTLCYDGNDPNKGVIDWNASTTVPGGIVEFGDRRVQGFKGAGYYLVGPKDDHFITDKGYQADWSPTEFDLKSSGMTSKKYTQNFQGQPITESKDLEPMTNITLVLQVLADPTKPEHSDPSDLSKPYNPFVTVDYFVAPRITPSQQNNQDPDKNPNDPTNEPSHVIAKYISNKMPPADPPEFNKLHSTGRKQPIRGQAKTCYYQNPQSTNPPPQHTFSKENLKTNMKGQGGKLDPFLPYFHFDRPLISTAEVFVPTCVSPMQFTQTFGTPGLTPQNAFYDVNSMLTRFIETITVGDRGYHKSLAQINGNAPLGAGAKHAILIPGKINLNGQLPKEVLYALFDAQTGAQGQSAFQQTDVDTFHQDLQTNARPIAGFSDYKFENGTITQRNTLFRDDAGQPFLFGKMIQNSTNGANDYDKAEAFRKVMNNITFTSNAFAVWVTVGFFEVDAANNPTKEIGLPSGSNIRHRMFAVVDRTQLMIPDSGQQQGITTLTALANQSPDGVTPSTLTLAASSGTINAPNAGPQSPKVAAFDWKLKSGMALTIDRGNPQKEETVLVTNFAGNTATVGPLRFSHAPGATVHLGGIYGAQVPANQGANYNYMLGHPGPQPNFSLRDYSYIVPYFTFID